MDESTQRFLDERNRYHAVSKELFKTEQDYLKKLEDLKEYKVQIKTQRNEYVENMTKLALRTANITYAKENYDHEELYWQKENHHQEAAIQEKREILEKALQEYRQIRGDIAAFQSKITLQLDKQRIHTLNTISFVKYTKDLIEKEMKNSAVTAFNYSLPSSIQSVLSNKRQLLKQQNGYYKNLEKVKENMKTLYLNKIMEFRQQERIYFGQARELIEQTLEGNHNSFAHNHADLLNEDDDRFAPQSSRQQEHFLEHAIINKICAKDDNDDDDGHIDDGNDVNGNSLFSDEAEDDLFGSSASMVSASGGDNNNTNSARNTPRGVKAHPPTGPNANGIPPIVNSGGGRVRRHSMVQHGDMVQFLDRVGRTARTPTGSGTAIAGGGVETNVVRNNAGMSSGRGKQGQTNSSSAHNINNIAGATATTKQILHVPNPSHSAGATAANHAMEVQPRLFTTTLHNNNNTTASRSNSRSQTASGIGIAVHINGSTYSTTPPPPPTTAASSSGSATPGNTSPIRKTNKESDHHVIYDPNEFIPACSGEYLRPYCILEMQKPIQEREERLVNIGMLVCKAKGKVKHLTHIKDGLDQELLKQGCLLMAMLDQLEQQTLASSFFTTPASPSSPQSRMASPSSKPFAAANIKPYQVEEMKKFLKSSFTSTKLFNEKMIKEKEFHDLQQSIDLLLRRHA